MDARSLKKPKLEEPDGDVLDDKEGEALQLLIKHRSAEVHDLKKKVAFYQSELESAEKRLVSAELKLARLRSSSAKASNEMRAGGQTLGNDSNSCRASRPQLVIPALGHSANGALLFRGPSKSGPHLTVEYSRGESSTGLKVSSDPQEMKKKQKKGGGITEQKEHKDLIPSVRTCSSSCIIGFQSGNYISSQHKRKLRSLVLCPTNDQIFATSALDAVVNLWQLQDKGSGALRLGTTDCATPRQRRWPEDLTWHPDGNMLFCVYSADDGDSQVSILDLNVTGKKRVTFLAEKPHAKGIINSIIFIPTVDSCFATGGSDHAVILWQEKDGAWKPKTLHLNQHSSAVMGVAGLLQKNILLSVGSDKRIVGFDLLAGRSEFKHQIECKCMSVLPNPCDFNLFMVQTGAPRVQLRLFDIRLRGTEIHSFGWKQDSSESQSALINQAWSPDGWYLSSGSMDPAIHLFDIRYNGKEPSQTVHAHQKRVFKAIWHQSIPLLTSISSDLSIGFHKVR
ncbi:hypothetical protein J5N97_022659 [Dioscorea zingiberensis]|uniref:Uncharacterized protein n=1 Tax=Dioscorea zingiberensis TaxID=325984 RepID=A0A9D5HB13_9LILI|nr:hypothetical protein J5N97_022659 [Dioscorea zingiberensis]